MISIEGIGKRYQLGETRYGTLWETMGQRLRHILPVSGRKVKSKSVPDTIWALKDISFNIEEGQVVGIIGRNGAGKSTLLKILSRITPPTTGCIRLRGRIASLLEVGTGFHPELTGRENIFMNGAILGMSRSEIRRNFDEIVEFSEVESFIDTPVKRYSSGMYVRLAFAVAAHLQSEILVVDEVLAVGDSSFQNKCLGKIDSVSKSGRTVLFVSHNMSSVERLCNRVIWLSGGLLKLDSSPAETVSRYFSDQNKSVNASVVLSNHSGRNKYTDKVLKKISLFDIDGNPVSCIRMGEMLKVAVELEANKYLKKVSFGFGFEDHLGRRIFSINSLMVNGSAIDVDPADKVCVELKLGSINLLPGQYYISLAIVESRREWIDSIDQAIKFEVLPADVYRTGNIPVREQGVVFVPGEIVVQRSGNMPV